MKHKTIVWLVAGSLACGCSTTDRETKASLEEVVRVTAAQGTERVLREKPEWRESFQGAAASLLNLSECREIDGEKLWRILDWLPVNELRGAEAAIYITRARVILDRMEAGEMPIDRGERLRGIVRALAAGVVEGLERTHGGK